MADARPHCPDRALVARLEEEWRAALFSKDEAALRRLIHPDFQLVGARGGEPMVRDLEDWIAALSSMDVAKLTVAVNHCVRAGDTIVATVDASWSVRYLGTEVTERVMLTDIWVKMGENWQVLQRHSSPLKCPGND